MFCDIGADSNLIPVQMNFSASGCCSTRVSISDFCRVLSETELVEKEVSVFCREGGELRTSTGAN
jgi:metal-sulfur cluster biosynthetic enzyme